MKSTILLSLALLCSSVFAVELTNVGLNTATFYNFSSNEYDLSGHYLTTGSTLFPVAELGIQKSLVVPPGQYITFVIPNTLSSPSSIGLWYPGTFPTSVVDFIQFGAAGQPYETEAVQAGRWVSGEFVQGSPPFERTSLNYSDIGASFWQETTVGTSELTTQTKIRVFPNPFLDELSVETGFTNGTTCSVTITDSKGMTVVNMQGIREKNIVIESAHLPRGTYYIQLESETGMEIVPVIKR